MNWPVDALVGLMRPLQAEVDHGGHSQRPAVPAQEGDIMASGQTLQAVADVVQSPVEEGLLLEHAVEVQVEQSDACGRTDRKWGKRTGANHILGFNLIIYKGRWI